MIYTKYMIIGSVVLFTVRYSLFATYLTIVRKRKGKKAVTLRYLSHFDTFLEGERERERETRPVCAALVGIFY